MHGDERVGLQLGQRDVFRVEGRRSAQLVGNVPCPAAEDGIAEQPDGGRAMRASCSRAAGGVMSPRCTASCSAERVWDRRSIGASS